MNNFHLTKIQIWETREISQLGWDRSFERHQIQNQECKFGELS